MAVVYKHTSPEGKVYIGICGSENIKYIKKDRWHYDGSGYKYNTVFWEDIQKFGWDNFTHEIILSGIYDETELAENELKYIRLFDSDNPIKGYNKKTHYRAVKCVDTGEIFYSIISAQRATGISSASIQQCCRGRTKTAGKMRWEYLEKEGAEDWQLQIN